MKTEAAPTARRRERQHDVLSDPSLVDALADAFDDAGALVPEHHRQGCGPFPVQQREVAAADAGHLESDEHLVSLRRFELQFLELERTADPAEDDRGDLHRGAEPVESRSTSSGEVSTTMSRPGAPPI